MANYNTTVQYYRINANNTAIATSNLGIGTAPTEEITAPVVGCTYDSGASGATIQGTPSGSQDFNDFSVNQYLYYIDGTTGAYVLMGQIQTIDPGGTELTLYANSLSTPSSGNSLVASYFLITNTESLYMRIATEIGGNAGANKINIPDFSKWRTSSDVVNGLNNTAVTALERISNVGTPSSVASPSENIPFTIQTMNVFNTGTGTNSLKAWPTIADFPQYMWIKITPSGTNNSLSSKTMYRLTTQETIEAFNTGILTSLQTLETKGYNVSGTGNTTNTNTGGGN